MREVPTFAFELGAEASMYTRLVFLFLEPMCGGIQKERRKP